MGRPFALLATVGCPQFSCITRTVDEWQQVAFFGHEEGPDRLHHVLEELIPCLVVIRFRLLQCKDHRFNFFMFQLSILDGFSALWSQLPNLLE